MKKEIVISLFVLLALQIGFTSAITMNETNYNVNPYLTSASTSAHFVVQTLKYEAYPVNAGDWFDLWVKIQNTGQEDAENAVFNLVADYPFDSNDTQRDFGIIPGTVNAYSYKSLGDNQPQTNQVIMKFRVHVADNAQPGQSDLKIETQTDSGQGIISYDLPIEIAKTKTDFDVKLSSVTPQETVFSITNIGDADAKSVSVDVASDNVNVLSGEEAAQVGDLSSGDFTLAHLKVVPTATNVTLMISYVDTANVRTTLEKVVQISSQDTQSACLQKDDSLSMWLFALGGLVVGVFVVVLVGLIKHKRLSKH